MDLKRLEGHEDPRVRSGWARRRAVLGDDYVVEAVAIASPLAEELQVWVTRDVWGATWGREALDCRARSLITIALLIAGGHQAELAAHVRGGLRNGLSAEEILEVVRHSAVYCGAPVALSAMHTVAGVLDGERATST